jgi:glyoxylase-like metal-dependent hydrolase (beta-lactamase superfamily II)
MISIKKIKGAEWISNCYIILDNSDAIIIDPGCEYTLIQDQLAGYKLKAIVATHGHYDHILNVYKLQHDYNVPFYLHAGDKKLIKHANFYLKLFHSNNTIEIPAVDIFISDLDLLDFDFVKMKVIHTPGHTEGSVCYLFENNLFTGDLLMKNIIGRTDLPGGNINKIRSSIKKIGGDFSDVNIFPGHGNNSTLGEEKKSNRALIKIMNDL